MHTLDAVNAPLNLYMPQNPSRVPMKTLLGELRRRRSQMLHLLEQFVCLESPSLNKKAVDRLGQLVAAEWRRRGANVHVVRQRTCGNQLRAEIHFAEGPPAGQLLILGHLDTVHPLGTLAKMPFRVAQGRAWGPGTFDMKSGLVLALFAVDALRAAGLRPRKRLVFFWNSDEETGSQTSRRAIECEARRSDAVLVLEPPLGRDGRLKTARKGVGSAEIRVAGRAAHAGINPQEGINAVHELALQMVRLMKLNNPRRGFSVQATVIAGGTAVNVVPDFAQAAVDIRFARLADAARMERRLRRLRPILPGARLEVRLDAGRPPLERTPAVRRLFNHARALMREMGSDLAEASTGGGSDGNFTAALGVPTLDGLGAIGDGAHSPREHILIRSLPERAALLAGLLATL